MSPDTSPTQDQAADAAGRTPLGLQRRALLRAGAGASPVLLSLASGPVSAAGMLGGQCVVASSFVSVATFKSRNPSVTTVQCSTQNADFWRTEAGKPSPPAALNATVSTLLGNTGSSYNSQTLKAVMLAPLPTSGTVQTTGELGTLQHLIAMVLNLNAGYVASPGAVNVAYLQALWINYKSNGNRYKLPASNIDWGDADIIAWLRFMMYPISI